MSGHSPPQLETEDQLQRRLVIERVLKRVRLSKAKRVLQTRLRLAGFKASHGWHNVSFEKIEPQLLRKLKTKQAADLSPTRVRLHTIRSSQCSGLSSHSYSGSERTLPALETPAHQRLPSYHSEPESANSFAPRVTPQMTPNGFNPPSSIEARSVGQPPAYPHTPEQIIRSKWITARGPSQSQSTSTPEDDELRDQTTAAEMMLFLATGSPSPDSRSINPVIHNRYHHAQIPSQYPS